MNEANFSIINVKDFLTAANLRIPKYQRPYKWTKKNVNQLIDDILDNRDKTEYRLGTAVFHRENDTGNDVDVFNIVDGQQRAITLTLIAHALCSSRESSCERIGVKKENLSLLHQNFNHTISQVNIRRNYEAIKLRVKEFDELSAEFFFTRCRVIRVVLDDISEAFQFFDSQNARGKDLNPHDLLKAFHLREMREDPREVVERAVLGWEDMDEDSLRQLFGQCLFRIRNWTNLKGACSFTKDDIEVFKGVNPVAKDGFPYVEICRLAHYCVDDFNQSAQGRFRGAMSYPHQIDQVILNGRRFFEMTEHYAKKWNRLERTLKSVAQDIYDAISNYEGRWRIGDCYVRNLFDCACFYYWDKFGETKDLASVIRKIFFWAYALRLRQSRVTFSTVDNEAKSPAGMMYRIRQALRPADLLNYEVPNIGEVQSTKTDKINDLFRKECLCSDKKGGVK